MGRNSGCIEMVCSLSNNQRQCEPRVVVGGQARSIPYYATQVKSKAGVHKVTNYVDNLFRHITVADSIMLLTESCRVSRSSIPLCRWLH